MLYRNECMLKYPLKISLIFKWSSSNGDILNQSRNTDMNANGIQIRRYERVFLIFITANFFPYQYLNNIVADINVNIVISRSMAKFMMCSSKEIYSCINMLMCNEFLFLSLKAMSSQCSKKFFSMVSFRKPTNYQV